MKINDVNQIPKHPHWAIVFFEYNGGNEQMAYVVFTNEENWKQAIRGRIERREEIFTAMHVMPATISVQVDVNLYGRRAA